MNPCLPRLCQPPSYKTTNIQVKTIKTHRKSYIDILRGIAIFLVVFGHITHISTLRTFIYGFHVPLFFFISGLLFAPEKYKNFNEFIIKKFKTLIIPYVFFYLMTFSYWWLIESRIRSGEVTTHNQILGLFYGTYNMKYMFFNGALWFLPCLFTTEMLYFAIHKTDSYRHKFFRLFVVYALGVILIQYNIKWLPWGGNAALIACFFYGIGDMMKKRMVFIETRPRFFHVIIIIVCIAMQPLLMGHTKTYLASLAINYYSCIPISLIGIALCLSSSILLDRNKVLEFIGINSLVIFAFQEQIYRMLIFVFSRISGVAIEILRHDFVLCILISFATIICITPLVFAYNRFFKPLLNNRRISSRIDKK